ncbi:GNAT family N-acetyltransferase [Micromonospora saelicesensis]|uniref:Acetyltransferase (GNAT) family protein n=1 Tax=Micromonospora saelicesensis TaxID=285676 RepID=A0A1C4UY57_9ACTN|nr:GNAT family N-acetyltransferase [Micromonospora saelicesensis]SCE76511.1 Acetyltransferase (GNAT) family protein [Micromonospora saelicesensis]
MRTSHDTVTIRPITGPDEIPLFNRLPYTINHELDDDLADKRRRPEWMWVAVRGDRLLARVAWWGRSGDDTPLLLDVLDVDDTAEDLTEVAQTLYETAAKQVLAPGAVPPEYGRFIPADWRENPDTYRAVCTRMGVLESTGARLTVERLRLEWRPAAGLPTPDRRLAFRPALDTDELVALMTRALDGTLDAHSRTDLAQMSPHEAALKHYEQELATYSSPREWWRIGTLGENGEPVGFVVPARNAYHPVIAYLGVVPEHRGHGYVDGLLAEGTRTLAAEDVPRIRAATDLGNVPMAEAFARAGYVNFERAINMAW